MGRERLVRKAGVEMKVGEIYHPFWSSKAGK